MTREPVPCGMWPRFQAIEDDTPSGLQAVPNLHNVALASLPNFVLPGDVSPSARYWQRDIVTPE